MNTEQRRRRALPAVCRRIDTLLFWGCDYHRRRAAGLTAAVARAAGCTAADLAAWRSGAALPAQGQLARLAAALGVTFLWLQFGHRGLPVREPRARKVI